MDLFHLPLVELAGDRGALDLLVPAEEDLLDGDGGLQLLRPPELVLPGLPLDGDDVSSLPPLWYAIQLRVQNLGLDLVADLPEATFEQLVDASVANQDPLRILQDYCRWRGQALLSQVLHILHWLEDQDAAFVLQALDISSLGKSFDTEHPPRA